MSSVVVVVAAVIVVVEAPPLLAPLVEAQACAEGDFVEATAALAVAVTGARFCCWRLFPSVIHVCAACNSVAPPKECPTRCSLVGSVTERIFRTSTDDDDDDSPDDTKDFAPVPVPVADPAPVSAQK